ncbi:MAG: aldo/keto reductase [Planctomycetota bacterium]|nr:aldo/keto reductase [Planctomycetota bacterium]
MDSTAPVPAMRRRDLGSTGIKVGEIGFGAAAIGGGAVVAGRGMAYGAVDDATSLAALARAFQLGVSFVDTADAYGMGHSETLVGKALRVAPRRVVVATKVGHVRRDPEPQAKDFSPEYIRKACDRSLSRLGVTCIDVYQLHGAPREVLENRATWDVLRELKDKGKIAHYGASIGAAEEGRIAVEAGEAETLQIPYHLLSRGHASLFPFCQKHGVGVIVRIPLYHGLLTGKYAAGHVFPENDGRRQRFDAATLSGELARIEKLRFLTEQTGRTLAQAALRFCLASDVVSVVIPGIKTPQQADENALAAHAPELTPGELKQIEASGV